MLAGSVRPLGHIIQGRHFNHICFIFCLIEKLSYMYLNVKLFSVAVWDQLHLVRMYAGDTCLINYMAHLRSKCYKTSLSPFQLHLQRWFSLILSQLLRKITTWTEHFNVHARAKKTLHGYGFLVVFHTIPTKRTIDAIDISGMIKLWYPPHEKANIYLFDNKRHEQSYYLLDFIWSIITGGPVPTLSMNE